MPHLTIERLVGVQQEPSRPLDALHLGESAGAAHRHRVGRPGGGEVHARPYLQHRAVQERLIPKLVGLERLGEEPEERAAVTRRQLA
jgi:hypothetical protein